MKIFVFIFFFVSVSFSAEQFSAESASFAINAAEQQNMYFSESSVFSISAPTEAQNCYSAESETFELTGIDEIPEPTIIFCSLLFLIFLKMNKKIL